MTNNKIQAYAERIENVLNEIDALKSDIKDIYEEVDSADINPRVLRKAIANKRRKTDAAFDAEVEAYSAALLAMPGATYRSVAEQTGISKSKLQRLVPKNTNGTTESCGGGEPSVPGSAEGVATTSSGAARVPSGPQDSEESGDRQSPTAAQTVEAIMQLLAEEIDLTIPAHLRRLA